MGSSVSLSRLRAMTPRCASGCSGRSSPSCSRGLGRRVDVFLHGLTQMSAKVELSHLKFGHWMTANPWFPFVLSAEMEHLRARDLDAYQHVWLGECRCVLDGAIYARALRGAPEHEPHPLAAIRHHQVGQR